MGSGECFMPICLYIGKSRIYNETKQTRKKRGIDSYE
jgi:hypothetical protein